MTKSEEGHALAILVRTAGAQLGLQRWPSIRNFLPGNPDDVTRWPHLDP